MNLPCISCHRQAFISDGNGRSHHVCVDVLVRGVFAASMRFTRLPDYVIVGIASTICRRNGGMPG